MRFSGYEWSRAFDWYCAFPIRRLKRSTKDEQQRSHDEGHGRKNEAGARSDEGLRHVLAADKSSYTSRLQY